MIESLRTRAEFDAVRTSGRVRRSGPLSVRFVRDDRDRDAGDEAVDAAVVSVAFAVARRVGNAVTRNTVRRRLRESLRELDRDGRVPPGKYLFVAQPQITSLNFHQIRSLVAEVLAP